MSWQVILHPEFEEEFLELAEEVQDATAKMSGLLARFGPQLGWPFVDTLEGSKYANMKELRFKENDGVWRIAFAFDPDRQAVLLIAGNKSGVSQKRFYKELIRKADLRFTDWLKA